MSLDRARSTEGAAPAALPLAAQPSRRAKLAGIVFATLLFMSPLLMLPHARAAQAEAWRPLGLRGETILALAVTSNEGERIVYAETHTGLWRYTTGTDTAAWERIDAGLPVGALGGPALAAWQVVPGRPLQIYALIGTGTARQLYRSDDSGRSWTGIGLAPGQTARPAMIVLPGPNGAPDQIILATGSRAQRSSDGGATWAPGGPWPGAETRTPGEAVEPVDSLLVDPSAPERLFARSRGATLWISENGGLSWRPSKQDQVTAIAITSYFGIRVWAANAHDLALSTDAGASWTGAPLPAGGRIVTLRSDTRVPETIYAARADGAVARSDDSGITWSGLGRPSGSHVTALALDPDLRSELYAATDDGVWMRTVAPPQPTLIPTPSATSLPTAAATASPSPTASPTVAPTASATASPTASPTVTPSPTASRTATPTRKPTLRPTATPRPIAVPTAAPTATAGESGGGQRPPTSAPPTVEPPTAEPPPPPTVVPPR